MNVTSFDYETMRRINAVVLTMLSHHDLTKLSPATAAKVREKGQELIEKHQQDV